MKYKGLWSRWHRFDSNNVKQIKRYAIDETPHPLVEDNYSAWTRGTGPLAGQQYDNVASHCVNTFKGKPKPPEQKAKMRDAKLGKPKTEEHKHNMSIAQCKRSSIGKPLTEQHARNISNGHRKPMRDKYALAKAILEKMRNQNG